MQKELLTKTDYANVGEEISHDLGNSFVKSYAAAHGNEVSAYHVGRNIIEQILAQPGCAGLRFYNAMNEAGQKTLVYVGVDAAGKDIVKRVMVQPNGTIASANGTIGDRAGTGGWDFLTWLGF